MDSRVLRLEELRQEVETFEYWVGTMGDYLDRGNPDDTQRKEAEAAMAAHAERVAAARRAVSAYLAEMRATTPEVVAAWVAWHVAWCDRIIAEGVAQETDEHGYATDQAVRVHVARETLAAWKSLRQGEDAVILVNRFYLSDYHEAMSAELAHAREAAPSARDAEDGKTN